MSQDEAHRILEDACKRYFLTGAIHRMSCPARYETQSQFLRSKTCHCGLYEIQDALRILEQANSSKEMKSEYFESCGF